MSTTTHVRQHNSMLAAAEKRVLIWIAERLPRWINSDHLSALGLAAMAGAGAVVRRSPRADPVAGASLVVLCLLLNWFGDSLDGTVARVRDQQRPRYGYYVDHVIDLAGTALLFAGLAASGLHVAGHRRARGGGVLPGVGGDLSGDPRPRRLQDGVPRRRPDRAADPAGGRRARARSTRRR